MSRKAIKTLHVTEPTWALLWQLFRVQCTHDEAIASMLWFIADNLGYTEKDFTALMVEYREAMAKLNGN